jgi:hypothetical protein
LKKCYYIEKRPGCEANEKRRTVGILQIDEKQAGEIESLYGACGKNDLELLRKHVLSALKPALSAETLPEWLYFNAQAKTQKALFHTADPAFVARIAGSKDLAVGWIDGIDWRYYDIARDVFIALGAMKGGLPASQKKPPSHIGEYAVKPSAEMRESIGNNISNCAVFGLKCRCGSADTRIRRRAQRVRRRSGVLRQDGRIAGRGAPLLPRLRGQRLRGHSGFRAERRPRRGAGEHTGGQAGRARRGPFHLVLGKRQVRLVRQEVRVRRFRMRVKSLVLRLIAPVAISARIY